MMQQLSRKQQTLLNEIPGVVFLATPHCLYEDSNGWMKFATILR